ncbi:MAG: CPBP family intramembrane metalloprotease [Planctomycetes bacterium]|nr:CPBP family intramembrane metalloprotease [Planctomycetota bacterium]
MKSYYHRSKSLANSFLFILPLLVLYEVGIAMQSPGIKNTADVVIKVPFALFGRNGSLIFNLFVIVFLLVSAFYVEKKYQFSSMTFILMFVEGAVYALFIGYGLGYVVYKALFPLALAKPFFTNIWTGIVFSVGAGVYEEIVFRLLLVSLLYFIFTKLLKIKKPISAIISVLIGALIFTSAHYLGPLKDSFTYASFTFRLLAGLVLSTIFMFRGLGVVVYTHAIYNVLTVLKPFQV